MNLNNRTHQDKIIREYLIYIKNVKNYSQNTVKSYSSDIKHYFANTKNIGEFSQYLKQLNRNNYSKASINRKITSIKLFLLWAVQEKYFDQSEIKTINSLKVEKNYRML